MRAGLVIAISGAACATTASVCPVGTKRVDVQAAQGRAQWCTTADPRLATVPTPGRDYTGVVGSEPKPMAGGVNGPFTSWFANGNIESHGGYLDFGSRSVPDGLWAFWFANGQRRTIGRYHRGEPTGCFASWDETGARSTGFLEGDQLRIAPCTPPSDDELAAIEGHATIPEQPVWADVSIQGLVGAGGIGARNQLQIDRDPSLRFAMTGTARLRAGRLRVGPLAGVRLSGNTDYRALSFGGVLGVGLPPLHRRLDTEIAVELGAHYITAIAMRPMQSGVADVAFWSPAGAVQASAALQLSPFLEAIAALRVDGAPLHDVDRSVTYCNFSGCLAPQQETWQVGGVVYGLSVGLRLVLR